MFGFMFSFITLPLVSGMMTVRWFHTANDPDVLLDGGPVLQRVSRLFANAWLLVTILSIVNSTWFIGAAIWPDAFWFLIPIPMSYGLTFGVGIMAIPMVTALTVGILARCISKCRPRHR